MTLEGMVKSLLNEPYFKEVIKEWALHVEDAAETKTIDATTFANLYLEMMRDPRNDETRHGCAIFMAFLRDRKWDEVRELLKRIKDKDALAAFETPQAEKFYKQFKAMVIEQIAEYWNIFITKKRKSSRRPKRRVTK